MPPAACPAVHSPPTAAVGTRRGYSEPMAEQPRFPHSVEFNVEVALDRNDDGAFDIVRVEVLAADHGEPRGIANATVYRIRSFGSTDHTAAAEELDESEFLVDVCRTAIDHETGFALEVYRETLEAVSGDALVLDRIDFLSQTDDTPVMRGMLARCVLDTLGRGEELLFLPPASSQQGQLWERSLGAVRVGHFWIASAGRVLPSFPLEAVD
jgi:hypothetical protein